MTSTMARLEALWLRIAELEARALECERDAYSASGDELDFLARAEALDTARIELRRAMAEHAVLAQVALQALSRMTAA